MFDALLLNITTGLFQRVLDVYQLQQLIMQAHSLVNIIYACFYASELRWHFN